MNLRRLKNRDCLSDGVLRGAVDNEVDRAPDIAAHLDECPHCRERMAEISGTRTFVDGRLATLLAGPPDIDTTLPRRRLECRIAHASSLNQESQGEMNLSTMWSKRAARGAIALVALMLLTTAFVATPMRSLADDLLNRSSVEKFEAVTVRMEDFGELQTTLVLSALSADHERLLEAVENLAEIETTFNQDDPAANMTDLDGYDDASEFFGEFKAPSDLPAGYGETPEMLMSDGGSASVTVDTESANVIIEELQLPIESVPDASEMPQMLFEVEIPPALLMHFQDGADGHIAVAQLESPKLVTPQGVDMDALREDLLDLPGLPANLVEQLEAIDDWRNTLVVPVPEGAETSDVTVGDEAGLMIEAGSFSGEEWGMDFQMDGDLSVVMWNDGGILYVVAGTLSGEDILEVANSLN